MNNINRRDFIAVHAMQELLVRFDPIQYNIQHIAKDAYAIADAMVVEAAK